MEDKNNRLTENNYYQQIDKKQYLNPNNIHSQQLASR